ncbi:hypothetical protein GCM10011316_04230 [Roseibium aquae]|uniref:DUF1176 domain-containing protein n=1 Tax=Roseibium aquae TaxID=1323746 RepID=A0A916T9B6_9HYPH|nr:DUF1176 domain-containing protein [Roseibium aquae]GGB35251.1 hypothetical protein GCM10011316_04230 [Roseibium aquae]
MIPLKLHFLSVLLAFSLAAVPALAEEPRALPVFDGWSVDCSNTGLCTASSFVRAQSIWLDLRVIHDWPADAQPLIRMTTNTGLNADGAIEITVDGTVIEQLPVAQLKEIQASIEVPAGFRPIGGEGFWYPTGPASQMLLQAMKTGGSMVVRLPVNPEPVEIVVNTTGLTSAFQWMDDRQNRTGTQAALTDPGDETPADAPNAIAIPSPDVLPPAVAARWDNGRFCSDIDPGIFAGLDAVLAQLQENATLYLLPCGAPTAYNTPYIALLANPDGKVSQLHFARMSENGPVATDLLYNVRWHPKTRQLESLFRGSGLGECGVWNRWTWHGGNFALTEEAASTACTGEATPLASWTTTWPPQPRAEE